MRLLQYMNANPHWKTELAAEPYCLDITQDGDYFILKYNQILSDMGLREVQEARGSIFRREGEQWICVCYPFDKFFNYGESHSAVDKIDWSTASVQQKIDGSLMKIWYDRDEWHISTNGTIDAYKAQCGDKNYGILFSDAIYDMPDFWYALDPEFTYMFELTSPYNRIVISYEGTHIWYLGRRHTRSELEDTKIPEIEGLQIPRRFAHKTLADCIAAAHKMGDDEEGYVVCDANFNRIKIKGDEYLALHKMRGNGPLTVLRVIEMWQEDSLDDFVAYYPEYKEFVESITGDIYHMIQSAENAYNTISNYEDVRERRDFARYANSYIPPLRAYLYAKLDKKISDANEFFFGMRPRVLASYVMIEKGTTKIGVQEDE